MPRHTPTTARSGYIWPGRYLLRPSYDVRVVYLDLNHWIGLAKANVGHPQGADIVEPLKQLRAAKAAGQVVFPLSSTHYMEMAGITQARQRRDIAGVMEELSGFTSLLSRAVVAELEIEAALDELRAPRDVPYAPLGLLGFGFGPSLGMRGGLRFRNDDGDDVTAKVRSEWAAGPEAFDATLLEASTQMERKMLEGPPDEDIESLRAEGWDPGVANRIAEERAQAERDQVARLDAEPQWRRGRLRDVVSARHLLFELNAATTKALLARGLSHDDVFVDRYDVRRFIDSMPTSDICVTLMTAAHRNPQRRWTSNDIFDIDAASIAAAYCDVVVMDSHVANALTAAKVGARASTTIFSSVAELADYLNL
jgi:hypothetical protein